jgi:hypothetical protein
MADAFSSAAPINALQETEVVLVNAIRRNPTPQNIRLLLAVSKTLAEVRQRQHMSAMWTAQHPAAQPACDAEDAMRRRGADAGAAGEAVPLIGAGVVVPAAAAATEARQRQGAALSYKSTTAATLLQ